jgi:hypothetical protein
MKQVIVLMVLTLLITRCESRKAREYACKQYSAECELQKDQILILPIKSDSTVLDAFGRPMSHDKNQWYILSTKVLVPIPINVPVCEEWDVETGCDYDYTPSVALMLKKWAIGDYRVDTIDLELLHGRSKSLIFVSGPNEVIAYSGNLDYEVKIIKP